MRRPTGSIGPTRAPTVMYHSHEQADRLVLPYEASDSSGIILIWYHAPSPPTRPFGTVPYWLTVSTRVSPTFLQYYELSTRQLDEVFFMRSCFIISRLETILFHLEGNKDEATYLTASILWFTKAPNSITDYSAPVTTMKDHGIPFCICPSNCGADLLFIVKLDDKHTWFALKASGGGSGAKGAEHTVELGDLEAQLDTLTSQNLFLDEIDCVSQKTCLCFQSLPDPLTISTAFPLLRLIASFTTEVDIASKNQVRTAHTAILDVALASEIISTVDSASPTSLTSSLNAGKPMLSSKNILVEPTVSSQKRSVDELEADSKRPRKKVKF
ncbi:hypothetical protein C8J56DRAFT_1120865 [Mycena floridula]|nr:hypothetical protein C8J56DRAFT_1120865 [Mycena floridula]